MIVLLAVYRSFWLALVPLATIGVSLVISRGVLAWMILAGWELSPLVELFLIAILFGTGTDFCLFLSWRYRRALQSEQSGRLDAGDAGPFVHGPGHERRHDHHRPAADGDDPVQAVFEHGPERRPGPGAGAGGHADPDARAAGAAGADSPASVRRSGRHARREFWDRLGARGDGPSAAKLAVHGAGDGPAVDPGAEDPFHPGPDDRAAREHRRRPGISGWSPRSSTRGCWLR